MPWRLIIFIVVFALFLVFVTFNLDNRCDISFGFAVIHNVPIFITVFASLVIGFFCTLPLIALIIKKIKNPSMKRNRRHMADSDAAEFSDHRDDIPPEVDADENIKKDAAAAKKRFFLNRKGNDD